MRKLLALGAGSLLVFAAALPLAAQTTSQTDRLTADIPFEFTVAGTTMPAGQYEVYPTRTAVVIRGIDHTANVVSFVIGDSIDRPSLNLDTSLVFNRYGNRYFLNRVVNGSARWEYSLPALRVERELAETASLNQEKVLAVLARR